MAVGVLDTPSTGTISLGVPPDTYARLGAFPNSAIPLPSSETIPTTSNTNLRNTSTQSPADVSAPTDGPEQSRIDRLRSTFRPQAVGESQEDRDQRQRMGWAWFMAGVSETLADRNPNEMSQQDFQSVINIGYEFLEMVGASPELIEQIRSTVGDGSSLRNAFATGNFGSLPQGSDWMMSGRSSARLTGFDSNLAMSVARSDENGVGRCAAGVRTILETMGWRHQRHGSAYEYASSVERNGWVLLRGVNPQNAPEGAMLIYDRDRDGSPRNRGGGLHGHIELVAVGADGRRRYVSDAARNNFGGSVPDNFMGAYVYVGPGSPPENRQIADQVSRYGPSALRTDGQTDAGIARGTISSSGPLSLTQIERMVANAPRNAGETGPRIIAIQTGFTGSGASGVAHGVLVAVDANGRIARDPRTGQPAVYDFDSGGRGRGAMPGLDGQDLDRRAGVTGVFRLDAPVYNHSNPQINGLFIHVLTPGTGRSEIGIHGDRDRNNKSQGCLVMDDADTDSMTRVMRSLGRASTLTVLSGPGLNM